jgi:hypothetical protein
MASEPGPGDRRGGVASQEKRPLVPRGERFDDAGRSWKLIHREPGEPALGRLDLRGPVALAFWLGWYKRYTR